MQFSIFSFLKFSKFRKQFIISSILPKNEQKQFDLRYHSSKVNFFVRFWKNWGHHKRHFEINWLLDDCFLHIVFKNARKGFKSYLILSKNLENRPRWRLFRRCGKLSSSIWCNLSEKQMEKYRKSRSNSKPHFQETFEATSNKK